MKKRHESLGQTELEILRYVSDHHPIRVGEVAEHFAETTGKARTTILTVMERLRKKRFLTRKKIEGTFHYSPKVAKTAVLENLVQKFVEQTLDGSLSPFMAYLADTKDLNDEEFARLKQLVHELESRRKGDSK
jgi:predicted transcriptional regulator